MNRGGYVSLFLKKFPALLQERGMSSYLLKKSASLIAKLATWMMNIAQNCQLVFRPDFLLVFLADNLSYHYSFAPEIGGLREETNISPSIHNCITGGRQSSKTRTIFFTGYYKM
jgi:hypothetical protein